MIHDKETTDTVRSAEMTYLVSDEMVAQAAGDALAWNHRRFAKVLEADIAERFPSFIIESTDLQFKKVSDPAQVVHDSAMGVTRFIAYWKPQTKIIELVGGPEDGQILEVRNIHDPLALAVHVAPILGVIGNYACLSPDRLTYRLDGWNDTENRWTFRTDGIAR